MSWSQIRHPFAAAARDSQYELTEVPNVGKVPCRVIAFDSEKQTVTLEVNHFVDHPLTIADVLISHLPARPVIVMDINKVDEEKERVQDDEEAAIPTPPPLPSSTPVSRRGRKCRCPLGRETYEEKGMYVWIPYSARQYVNPVEGDDDGLRVFKQKLAQQLMAGEMQPEAPSPSGKRKRSEEDVHKYVDLAPTSSGGITRRVCTHAEHKTVPGGAKRTSMCCTCNLGKPLCKICFALHMRDK